MPWLDIVESFMFPVSSVQLRPLLYGVFTPCRGEQARTPRAQGKAEGQEARGLVQLNCSTVVPWPVFSDRKESSRVNPTPLENECGFRLV